MRQRARTVVSIQERFIGKVDGLSGAFIARVTSHIPDKSQVSLEGELTSPSKYSPGKISGLKNQPA
jgi:hypothetical protein